MRKFIVWTLLMVSALSINAINKLDPELTQKIKSDQRMNTVKSMAEELIKKGLTAGDGYVEVWIRDLNTFIETACAVSDQQRVKEALITFFKFQGEDGNIPDGYTTKNTSSIPYEFIHSDLEPRYVAHKNTVETDQESSLIQSIFKYVSVTGDKSILKENVGGRTVLQRMEDAMNYLLTDRYDKKHGLLWGATTADWGDVQPEHEWGVYLDSLSHLCIDIYDNAMFVVAMNDYIQLTDDKKEQAYWKKKVTKIKKQARKYMWDKKRQKFRPHVYLKDSPFPADFDEDVIHYHGGTTIAMEAGILSTKEVKTVYHQMQENVKAANAQSVGLTVYPPYPKGLFKNTWMFEYHYQNGGDWTWFGGRTVQQLIEYGYYEEAYEAISPMLDLVIKNNGFYEWWSPEGKPLGSSSFRGAAGVLWKAIYMFEERM